MTKIKIEQLIWDAFNLEHIKKHKVTKEEVEEVVQTVKTHKYVKEGRILLMGRTGKRIVSVIVSKETENRYYPITARDAAKKERRQFYESEKK